MIVVCDSSPLIVLGAAGLLDLLRDLHGGVLVPPAVHDEVALDGTRAGAQAVLAAEWIEVRAVTNQQVLSELANEVDFGEAEAMALAVEMNADLLILDDHKARGVAKALGLTITGVGGLLVDAKAGGLISSVKPVLDDLISSHSFRVSSNLYRALLRLAGES